MSPTTQHIFVLTLCFVFLSICSW